MQRHLVLSVIVAALCIGCGEAPYEEKHDHRFLVSHCAAEELSRENLGKRLWVQLEHGPSKSSGWIYTVGYPEFFITNGENTAEIALRAYAKRKCFCEGEWWLKTNGWIQAVRVTSRRRWHCECGHTEYQYYTNTYSIGESEY